MATRVKQQRTIVTSAATAVSTAFPWVPLDVNSDNFNVGFGVKVGAGAASFVVQHTFDNVFTESSVVAFDHTEVSVLAMGSIDSSKVADGNYAFGVQAIRLVVVSVSGSPVVSFWVVQPGT